MKLAFVLLIASSLVVVYGLADPAVAPTVRGKSRAKSQLRSRTGTRIRVDPAKLKPELPKIDYIATTENTPVTETSPTIRTIRPKEDINLVTMATPTTVRTPSTTNASLPDSSTQSSTILPALGNPECQQNDLLNRLLLRVLLSSMVTTTTQNPLMENLNRLFNINPSSAASPTTVVTSTAISTITQLFSTIVNVMFRNRKLPTTIYSSSTLVVTELQTLTSTLPFIDPPPYFRFKREAGVENQLQSSISEDNSIIKMIEPTLPLSSTDILYAPGPTEPAIDIDRLMTLLNQPEIRDAWNQFLQVLHRVL